ncbi:MAG: polysaccharide biosynthesis/export family protein [Pirellulales bacterium]|nr:polysaccharide biosynthesis/export family protein [Pirellulales bacterium]
MPTLPNANPCIANRPAQAVVAWCALGALLLSGCASAERYQAARLPAKFAAPPVENVRRVDLSQLANLSLSSEMIDRGDILGVTIATDYAALPTTTVPVRVGEDGHATIPQIGRVELAGLKLEEAEQIIAAAGVARNLFRNPHVTVTLQRRQMNRITVIGAVEKTGVVRLPRGSSSLLEALVEAGGLSKDAGPDVEIRRARDSLAPPTPELPLKDQVAKNDVQLASHTSAPTGTARVQLISLTESIEPGDPRHRLGDGDVVMVHRRVPKPIHVIGLVNKPDQYELPYNQEVRVLDALAMAGDRTMQAADRVLIIRQVKDREEPIQIEVSVNEAKARGAANIRLAPGDIVSVEETPTTIVLSTLQRVVRVAIGGSIGLL